MDIHEQAETIVRAYKKDQHKANAFYANNSVTITGKVLLVGESGAGQPMLMFDRETDTMLTVACYFPKNTKKQLKQIKVGSVVTVTGVCAEKAFGDIIEIRNCSLPLVADH